MRFKFLVSFIILLILASCNNIEDSQLTSIEGIISDKRDNNQRVVVIPNIDKSDLTDKDLNDLLTLAQEDNGIYLNLPNEEYENYKMGDKLSIGYDLEGDVDESKPPIRAAANIRSLDGLINCHA